MKNFSRVLAAALAAISVAFLSAACAPNVATAVAVTPTPEAAAAVTASPTATLSPTPTPSPEPTPIVDEYGFTEERKAELTQQFQDFLNKQGEFTSENMSSRMMITNSILDVDEVGLGIADVQPKIQGYFFDYIDKGDIIVMFMGFDGKDGNRFITPVEIPIYFQEGVDPALFLVDKLSKNYIGAFTPEDKETRDYGDKKALVSLLDDLKNNVIVLTMNVQQYDKSEAFKGLDQKAYQVAIDYLDELNPKVVLSFGLFQLIPSNGIEYDNPKEVVGDSEAILRISDINEINNIDTLKIPIVGDICYFSGILD